MILVAFILGSGLGGCNQSPPSNQVSPGANSTIATEDKPIPLILPPTARVILKQGGTKSGRLKAIDPQTQQLTLFSGSDSQVAIEAIKKLVFEGEVVLRSQTIVIRGEEESSGNHQETWSEPLVNFKVRDPSKGEAELKLTSLSLDRMVGVLSVSRDSSYVVEEMRFQTPKMLTIRVTPR